MTDLRQALEESANSATNFVEPKTPVPPEQEAFTLDRGCWERGCCAYDTREGDGVIVYAYPVNMSEKRVHKTAKCIHEPVAWLSLCYTEDGDPLGYTAHEQKVYGSFPVYTAPPKQWVGLTDEEGAEIWGDAHDIEWNRLVTPKEIVKRIEAKLKEKNCE